MSPSPPPVATAVPSCFDVAPSSHVAVPPHAAAAPPSPWSSAPPPMAGAGGGVLQGGQIRRQWALRRLDPAMAPGTSTSTTPSSPSVAFPNRFYIFMKNCVEVSSTFRQSPTKIVYCVRTISSLLFILIAY